MTETSVEALSVERQTAVRDQLDRIVKSGAFAQSQRRRRFLEYIVGEALAGRGDRLKGYAIARDVFDRDEAFDPNIDPVVRVEAGRLRDRLREYYEGEGRSDPIRIELPKGGYAPTIEFRLAEPASQQGQVRGIGGEQRAGEENGSNSRSQFSAIFGWPTSAMLMAAVALVLAVGFWGWRGGSTGPTPEKPSIAVLPFDNIGSDERWQRFADGITEDIITDLAHFRNLHIIARNHVWSERYDRPVDDLFAVQNEVTQRIAATLGGYGGAVAEAERRVIRRKPPASLTAFDTYLLGVEAKHKVTKDGLIEAERLFRKALELDPQLARAHVALVEVQFYLIDLGLAPSVDEAVSKMIASADMAVKLDPNDGKAHSSMGLALLYQGNRERAAAAFARAESLAPSDADMLLSVGWSLPLLAESERGVRLADRALTLNPQYPDWYNQGLSFVYFFGGQFEKAVKYRLLVKHPLALDYAFLALAHAYLDRAADTAAAAANVKNLDPAWNAERYLSEGGGYAEKEAEVFVGGARKARLPACVAADALKDIPNLIRVKSCDAERGAAPR